MIRRALMLCAIFFCGCEKHEFHPASREARQAEAAAAFAQARFDTIPWPSEQQRLTHGNEVFAERCRRCHGPLGRGDGDYARAEGLAVPSLVMRDWRYGAAPDSVRRRIFFGHYPEMRTWGIAGLSLREIDAVAHYIVLQLRPEVIETR